MHSIMSVPAVWQIESLHIPNGSVGFPDRAIFHFLPQLSRPFFPFVNVRLTAFQLLFLVSSVQFCYSLDTSK